MAYVLLIDDHPDVADILSQLLTARGHTVECCPSAEEALSRLEVRRPNIVVADQRLPGITGVEFIRTIRARDGGHGPPVILCSADDSLADQAREAGAAEFWVKGSERLFEHVERLAQRLSAEHDSVLQ